MNKKEIALEILKVIGSNMEYTIKGEAQTSEQKAEAIAIAYNKIYDTLIIKED